MLKLGIDLGSSYTKGVLVNDENQIVDQFVVKTGFDFKRAASRIMTKFEEDYEIATPVYTCGYGRDQVDFEHISNSEIMALSKAVFTKFNKKCAVIDIGGQDTKFIKINQQGQVDKFKMNRKCAAGTGSFLEEIAFRLDISPLEFNSLTDEATGEVRINSYCTVFAISEIIGLIKKGATISNIAVGIYNSIIERCMEMVAADETIIITGGVPEKHPTIVRLFKKNSVKWKALKTRSFLLPGGIFY
ncbi:MAG: acyl-CoA dehydratase activase [Bacteroidales bacterium]|nr:acyl-CoA dehydratase activase [Bacteroidales bacterium]